MKAILRALLAASFGSYSLLGVAYERETHDAMAAAAANSSVLKDQQVLRDLGVTFQIDDPSQTYPDSTGTERSIVNLIRIGANFEDGLNTNGIDECDTRPKHHFYDPVYERGLQWGVVRGERSPDWALEDIRDTGDQQYSLKDARDHLYNALTSTTEDDRKRYFGLTFQALGHVIHHLQDMAQPEHVRNDIHVHVHESCAWSRMLNRLLGDPSLYESWTNRPEVRRSLPFNGYGHVAFPTAREYWTTGDERGMADFTNRNFLSKDTNFLLRADGSAAVNSLYPLPSWDSTSNPVPIRTLLASDGTCPFASPACQLDGEVIFFGTAVRDTYARNPAPPNRYASTLSIFDQDLETYGRPPIYYDDPDDPLLDHVEYQRLFTLNRFNFRFAHSYLIPRAVAYSAGLIDYFFRGRLEAEDVEFTDTGIRLRIKNAIDAAMTPAWKDELIGPGGTLLVAYDYKDSEGATRYRTSSAVALTAAIAPGEVSAAIYTFNLSVSSGVADVNYRLVYRGRVGQEEDGIAVETIEPISGFLVTPNYTPADGIRGRRLVHGGAGRWKLDDKQDLVTGNLDWKGRYVNGKAMRVLTWNGPPRRYFPHEQGYLGAREIYQHGELWAVAPYPLLGAAIATDRAGREWLIAICQYASGDIVYRKPNSKDASAVLFDPVAAPNGWQQVGYFPSPTGIAPDRAWFFNGPGNEAQTMRRKDPNGLTRLKLTIEVDSGTAQIDDMGNEEGVRWLPSYDNRVEGAPPPPGACTPGSGTEVRDEVSTYVHDGAYVIAADYQDTREVLARVMGTGTETHALHFTQNWSIARCATPWDAAKREDAVTSISIMSHTKTLLEFDGVSLVLSGFDGAGEETTLVGRPLQPEYQIAGEQSVPRQNAIFISTSWTFGTGCMPARYSLRTVCGRGTSQMKELKCVAIPRSRARGATSFITNLN